MRPDQSSVATAVAPTTLRFRRPRTGQARTTAITVAMAIVASGAIGALAGLALAGCSSSGDAGSDGGGPGPGPDAAAGPGAVDASGMPDSDGGPGPDAGPPPPEVAGCDGASLLAVPADPTARGPWPVGARTLSIAGLTTEIWYPATLGSGGSPAIYDIRLALPVSEQEKIPDADNPWQSCDCVRDLPLDVDHGPYPVIVFIHGTASFRTQSLSQAAHWASRGFIVLAADHPGLWLADSLALFCGTQGGQQDLAGDVEATLAALAAADGALAFLDGHLALDQVGLVGHSAGANAVSGLSDATGVRVVIPMAGNQATAASSTLASVLYLAGESDGIVSYASSKSAYQASATPRRFVGLGNAGHLAFSDLCDLRNADDQNLLQIAETYEVCGAQFAGFLFDCSPTLLPGATSRAIVAYATTAVLEGVLHCSNGADAFETIQSTFPDVSELLSSP
jgi:fermentation-respiration switch protein FrsA (DUF1100 family)